MNITQIMENINIKSDRFGMAAISYIFKAFGDNIRSKEYWPWGKDVQCLWTPTEGCANDINTAINLLLCAIEHLETDVDDTTKAIGAKTLKERLKSNIMNSNNANNIANKIKETSSDINKRVDYYLENYE